MKTSPEIIHLEKKWLEEERLRKEMEETRSIIRWAAFLLITGTVAMYLILTIAYKAM